MVWRVIQFAYMHNHPTVFVLLGAAGDLAQRKLLPALFDLYVQGELPKQFCLLGSGRREFDDQGYKNFVVSVLQDQRPQADQAMVDGFEAQVQYEQGDFNDAALYQSLYRRVHEFNESIGQCANVLFYLAVPPSLYSTMFHQLAENKSLDICAGTGAWARLLVEKPFGNDVKTAYALEEQLCGSFADEQIYRIDHYLAKTAVENITTLRFGNSILQKVWDAECIESIDVTLHESIGIEGRGAFYEGVGALRDVGQNHLLQIISLLLMKRVNLQDAEAVREERARVVDSLRFDSTHRPPVRGQYDGYLAENGVSPESQTETYFSCSLASVAPEWIGVPITVSVGKALPELHHEAVITFRSTNVQQSGILYDGDTHTNQLRIRLAPEQKMSLTLLTRSSGRTMEAVSSEYQLVRPELSQPDGVDAYERVLLDGIRGNQSRFVSSAEVLAAWRLVEIIRSELLARPLVTYQPGTAPTE